MDHVLSADDVLNNLKDNRGTEAASKIRKAVEHERKRLWNAHGEPTVKTALGRELQKRLRSVGPVANRDIDIAANQMLQAKSGEMEAELTR